MSMTILSGLAFGAALAAAGVYNPAVIVSQLKFENWHMIKVFLTATASSSIIVFLLDYLSYYRAKPRPASPLGLLGPYDGNVIGGVLQGLGMALSGACSGTVILQAALGVPSGLHALLGTVLGGLAWSCFLGPAIARVVTLAGPTSSRRTVYQYAGITSIAMLFYFEAACAGILYAIGASTLKTQYASISPALGGLCIGFAQLLSILSRKTMIGMSAAYEEAGDYLIWLAGGASGNPPAMKNILFAASVAAGAKGLILWHPGFKVEVTDRAVSPLLAVAGGVTLALGSRVAGGCSSGHGISGVSSFSLSSFITTAAMFATGALITFLLA